MNTVMTVGYYFSITQVSLFFHITCCMEFLTSLYVQKIEYCMKGAWFLAVLVVESVCSEDKILHDECMIAWYEVCEDA